MLKSHAVIKCCDWSVCFRTTKQHHYLIGACYWLMLRVWSSEIQSVNVESSDCSGPMKAPPRRRPVNPAAALSFLSEAAGEQWRCAGCGWRGGVVSSGWRADGKSRRLCRAWRCRAEVCVVNQVWTCFKPAAASSSHLRLKLHVSDFQSHDAERKRLFLSVIHSVLLIMSEIISSPGLRQLSGQKHDPHGSTNTNVTLRAAKHLFHVVFWSVSPENHNTCASCSLNLTASV